MRDIMWEATIRYISKMSVQMADIGLCINLDVVFTLLFNLRKISI